LIWQRPPERDVIVIARRATMSQAYNLALSDKSPRCLRASPPHRRATVLWV